MADNDTYPILSLCATVQERLSDLSLVNGQLIFIQDKNTVALDYNGRRRFYHQITELASESARTSLLAPVSGQFYFVVETGVLWSYQSGWMQVTAPPEEIVYMGGELPSLGKDGTLYVNKSEKNISVWDEETQSYSIVSDKTNHITVSDIDSLFE